MSHDPLDVAAAATLSIWSTCTWRGGLLLACETARAIRARRPVILTAIILGVGANVRAVVDHVRSSRRSPAREGRPRRVTGLALAWCGLLWSWRARRQLGAAWSPGFDLVAPEVVADRAYARVRHPIYAGAIVFYAGLLLAGRSRRAATLHGAQIVGYVVKTSVEDGVLRASSPAYRRFALTTRWKLVPGVH